MLQVAWNQYCARKYRSTGATPIWDDISAPVLTTYTTVLLLRQPETLVCFLQQFLRVTIDRVSWLVVHSM